ncbi:hypothetical protein BOTCAL_0532g00020 [Botryotinia calthae]|uniref:Uncharacterized protein n=1 Tax=Botryotinia calthae TaxID=38488 RepID=A0A4Y8CKK6_9HELO|nr:hypothetical protein BOTCAL_0532g00020 [Botryotinia calthae]
MSPLFAWMLKIPVTMLRLAGNKMRTHHQHSELTAGTSILIAAAGGGFTLSWNVDCGPCAAVDS